MSQSAIRPAHYKKHKYEVVAVVRDWNLGFNLGNSLKYIARAGKKDVSKHIEDLEKAIEYINIEIGFLKEETEVKEKITHTYTDNWEEVSAGVCAPGISLNKNN